MDVSPSLQLQRRVGRRVAELRKEMGLTQVALVKQLGFSVGYLCRIESGGENLTLKTLSKIAAALSVEAEDLFVHPADLTTKLGRPRKPT